MSNCQVKVYLLPADVHGGFEVDEDFKKLPLISQLDIQNKWLSQIQRCYQHTLVLFCFEIIGSIGAARSWDDKLKMFGALAKSMGLELPHDFDEIARKHLVLPIVRDHVSCIACRTQEH